MMFKYPELFCSAVPIAGGHQHEKRVSEHNARRTTGWYLILDTTPGILPANMLARRMSLLSPFSSWWVLVVSTMKPTLSGWLIFNPWASRSSGALSQRHRIVLISSMGSSVPR